MSSCQWCNSVTFYQFLVGPFTSDGQRHDTTCPPADGVTPLSCTRSLLDSLHPLGGGKTQHVLQLMVRRRCILQVLGWILYIR